MDRTSAFSTVLLDSPSQMQGPRQWLVLPDPPERHRPAKRRRLRKRALALTGALVVGSLASPAIAAPEQSARLVRCGAQSCLRITGHREKPALIVSINGHVVPVEGKRSWEVNLAVEAVREWSAPYARTIEVSLHDPETQRETIASIGLPIGLLGGVTNLASLVVSVR